MKYVFDTLVFETRNNRLMPFGKEYAESLGFEFDSVGFTSVYEAAQTMKLHINDGVIDLNKYAEEKDIYEYVDGKYNLVKHMTKDEVIAELKSNKKSSLWYDAARKYLARKTKFNCIFFTNADNPKDYTQYWSDRSIIFVKYKTGVIEQMCVEEYKEYLRKKVRAAQKLNKIVADYVDQDDKMYNIYREYAKEFPIIGNEPINLYRPENDNNINHYVQYIMGRDEDGNASSTGAYRHYTSPLTIVKQEHPHYMSKDGHESQYSMQVVTKYDVQEAYAQVINMKKYMEGNFYERPIHVERKDSKIMRVFDGNRIDYIEDMPGDLDILLRAGVLDKKHPKLSDEDIEMFKKPVNPPIEDVNPDWCYRDEDGIVHFINLSEDGFDSDYDE